MTIKPSGTRIGRALRRKALIRTKSDVRPRFPTRLPVFGKIKITRSKYPGEKKRSSFVASIPSMTGLPCAFNRTALDFASSLQSSRSSKVVAIMSANDPACVARLFAKLRLPSPTKRTLKPAISFRKSASDDPWRGTSHLFPRTNRNRFNLPVFIMMRPRPRVHRHQEHNANIWRRQGVMSGGLHHRAGGVRERGSSLDHWMSCRQWSKMIFAVSALAASCDKIHHGDRNFAGILSDTAGAGDESMAGLCNGLDHCPQQYQRIVHLSGGHPVPGPQLPAWAWPIVPGRPIRSARAPRPPALARSVPTIRPSPSHRRLPGRSPPTPGLPRARCGREFGG